MDNSTLNELLTEEEIRQRMSTIAREYPTQREALKTAYTGLAKAEAKAQLAITFLEDDVLENPDAKKYLQTAKENGTKLTVADKEAIVLIETDSLKTAYDLAKFDADSSDKDFSKLEALLSFYQSMMRFTGAIEK